MSEVITDIDALEARVGKLPGPRDLKVIDHLDETAIRWISASPLLFATFGDANGIDVTAGGGEAGFARVDGPKQLSLPLLLTDDPKIARIGQGFGSLFLVPGIDETLRVNGRVASATEDWLVIAVEECYMHCGKALMRSEFWAAQSSTPPEPAGVTKQLNGSRFMALATIDSEGRADLSPKGDPAGALLKLRDGDVWYPDRPGNRRIDSFRNILTQSRIAAMALIPGTASVVHINGTARVTADEAMSASFAVSEKIPKVVTCIEQAQLRMSTSQALLRARLWPTVKTATDLDPAEIFKAHVKLSRGGGVTAAIARASVSVPGLMRKALDHDYKKNMY